MDRLRMDPPPNLETASRETLLDLVGTLQTLVATQQQTIATLTERVGVLEEQIGRGRPRRPMPGTKPTEPPATPPTPRTPRGLAFVRRRSVPSATVTHAPEQCPDCGTRLVGGWVQRTREVIEVPLPSATITEHRFLARTCPSCTKRVTASPTPLAGVVAGRQRLGVGLLSLIVTLREELRVPVRAIRWLLARVYGVQISVGSIVGSCHRLAEVGAATVASWRAQVREAPVLHADETGWREQGRNGYIWTLASPTVRTFAYGRRSRDAFHTAVGGTYTGTLVSDFYGVYAAEDGPHQWCWVHLLRDIHALTEQWPQDVRLRRWAAAVRQVFDDARTAPVPAVWERGAILTAFTDRLMAVCTPFLEDRTAPQRPLCRRIEKSLGGLFTFVIDPAVPPDNNLAERSLRHLVTARKISGGTRSPKGTATKMTLASLFGTWRLTGSNPLDACRALLVSHQP